MPPTPPDPHASEDLILGEIARQILSIDTLALRNSDSLDFHEVGVASLLCALRAAYAAGNAGAALSKAAKA